MERERERESLRASATFRSISSLCHPCVTTTHLSYISISISKFPIFETSAAALCGTTGTCVYAHLSVRGKMYRRHKHIDAHIDMHKAAQRALIMNIHMILMILSDIYIRMHNMFLPTYTVRYCTSRTHTQLRLAGQRQGEKEQANCMAGAPVGICPGLQRSSG